MDPRWQQADQAQGFTIGVRECSTLVAYGVMENFYTTMKAGKLVVIHGSVL
jgi:hypothetical protein